MSEIHKLSGLFDNYSTQLPKSVRVHSSGRDMSQLQKLIGLFKTRRRAAKALGVSENAVSKWCKNGFLPPNRAVPTIDRLKELGIIHQLTLEGLLREAYELSQK